MSRKTDFVDECYAGKDLSLLKMLTLVIPTYNRKYYLSRCLWYHAHFPFGEIIVADSSPEEKKVVNRETVAKVRERFGANVRYLEYEPETEKYGGDIYRKWGDAVQHSEKEYCIICTDKEYLVPTTLCECVRYLSSHLDYSSAEGHYYEIKQSFGRHYFEDFYPGRTLSIDNDNALDRLKTHLNSTIDSYNLLALRRTTVYNYIYDRLFDAKIDDLRFGEIGFELLSVIVSKSIYFNDMAFKYRDSKSVSTFRWNLKSNNSSASRYPLIVEYQKNCIYSKYLDKLSTCIYNELTSRMGGGAHTNTSLEECKDMIITMLKNRNFLKQQPRFIFYMGLLLNYMPYPIYNLVNKLLKRGKFIDFKHDPEGFRHIIDTLSDERLGTMFSGRYFNINNLRPK